MAHQRTLAVAFLSRKDGFMAVNTRPYLVGYKGTQHMVEATSPAAAAAHVVSSDLTELRPARAVEVGDWYKAGKPVEIAGEKKVEAVEDEKAPEPEPEVQLEPVEELVDKAPEPTAFEQNLAAEPSELPEY
jgi:hypothetical protein